MLKNDGCNDNQNDKNMEKYFKDFQCVAGSVLHKVSLKNRVPGTYNLNGLSWIIMDYRGLSWIIMDYHGLSSIFSTIEWPFGIIWGYLSSEPWHLP